MEKLRSNFNNIQKANPSLSTMVCLALTMRTGKYSMKQITDAFNELVDKEDYKSEYHDKLLTYLIERNRNYSKKAL